jgi:ferredoxin
LSTPERAGGVGSVLIVGSGPAAAGAALAAVRHEGVRVTVIDVGGQLECENENARARLAAAPREDWDPGDLETVSRQPVASEPGALPEKRAFGSDYPFRDFGQREAVRADAVNEAVISGAYGGFSNSWGAQFMPFSDATFRDWPIPAAEMRPHYEAILRNVPFAGEPDDLEEIFPLLSEGEHPLPELSARTGATLARYERRRSQLNRRGILLGRARLAFDGSNCVRCGLCMTGCPYSLIYAASQTFSELRRASRIEYHGGLMALTVEEGEDAATVVAKEVEGGKIVRFSADKVMLACGAIGTSRIALSSLGRFDQGVQVQESRQFRLPFLSLHPVPDPRRVDDFTLNQFNMVIKHDSENRDLSQLHFYTYNPAFEEALPRVLRRSWAVGSRAQLLRRVTVALGYLPSWASPKFTLTAKAPTDEGSPAALELGTAAGSLPPLGNQMFRQVVGAVVKAGPSLDLWPVLAALRMSPGGKSYHWGGTFPHASSPTSAASSDSLGRVAPWRRIHLVDSSVFPNVPATTFAMTLMANAHRIVDTTIIGEV